MQSSARITAELGPRVRYLLLAAGVALSTACLDSTSPNDHSSNSTIQQPIALATFPSTCASTLAAVTGYLTDGSLFEFCIPANPVGLLLYAHGYTQAGSTLGIVDDSVPTGTGGMERVSDIATSAGFVFGTTSYPHVGLNGPEGVASLSLLKEAYTSAVAPLPAGALTYVAGVSEGGMVAGLAAEGTSGDFQGVLAACGPVGDLRAQLNYFGDFRVLFDYFFPGVLGPPWTDGPEYGAADRSYVAAHWAVYKQQILAAILTHPLATSQLITTSRAPIDPLDPASVGETVVGVLWYNIFATDDSRQRLGGRPFDNHNHYYTGSLNDSRLNATVKRFTAQRKALATIASEFRTTGALQLPVVTDHTLLDPIVKASQELLYATKVALAGQSARLTQLAVARYGHCAFTVPELQLALSTLVQKTSGAMLAATEPGAVITTPHFGAFSMLGRPVMP
jgi:hypothetical protein